MTRNLLYPTLLFFIIPSSVSLVGQQGSFPTGNGDEHPFTLGEIPFRQLLHHRLDACASGFLAGSPDVSIVPKETLCAEVFGRLVKGRAPSDFVMMTDDPDRKVVYVIGQHTLVHAMNRTVYQLLVTLGWSHEYIRQMAADRQFKFKIVLFGRGEKDIREDTWENMIAMLSEAHPTIADKLHRQLPALRSTPLAEIERNVGYTYASVWKKGRTDPRYITVAKLESSEGTLDQIRLFLYLYAYAHEAYTGDGNGYLMFNRPLAALGEQRHVDIAYGHPSNDAPWWG